MLLPLVNMMKYNVKLDKCIFYDEVLFENTHNDHENIGED